jgi:hypothetical protein
MDAPGHVDVLQQPPPQPPQPPQTIKEKKHIPWLKPWIERIAHSIQSPETQEWIQLYLLDPIISYIIERCFPYFLIFAIVGGIIFILLIVTVVIMIIKVNGIAVTTTSASKMIPDVLIRL